MADWLAERSEFELSVPQDCSASESSLCGFSAQNGEIARACGFICVMRGTGENHFPAVRAQDAAKVSVGK